MDEPERTDPEAAWATVRGLIVLDDPGTWRGQEYFPWGIPTSDIWDRGVTGRASHVDQPAGCAPDKAGGSSEAGQPEAEVLVEKNCPDISLPCLAPCIHSCVTI